MRRVVVSALLASALCLPAFADPLVGGPYPGAASQPQGRPAADPPAAPQRYATTSPSNLGGGFLEFLFGNGMQRPSYLRDTPQYAPSSTGDMAHPPVDPKFDRQEVAYDGAEPSGTIVVDTSNKFLYLVESDGRAMRYGIGVGREGFAWSGVQTITGKREWPDWRPPDEMIRRRPDLPRYMAGGPENPLGARAMYLGSTLYRIHGSNEPWTIGTNVSSGCIRMRNEDVSDLYDRVKVGTRVVVM